MMVLNYSCQRIQPCVSANRRGMLTMKEQAINEAVERGFLNPGQAARFLSISRRYLGHLTGIGVIPVHRLGTRCVRYARADLVNAMQSFRRGK